MTSLFPRGATRRPRPMPALCLGLLALAFLSAGLARAADPNFNGHYELTDAKAGRAFSLDVKLTGSRADVSFSAAMADGSGAAPDGEGQGNVEDGVLSFKFKDSFNNEGTCTLKSMTDGYHLDMVVTKVVDPGPFHFYGNILLKKKSNHPML